MVSVTSMLFNHEEETRTTRREPSDMSESDKESDDQFGDEAGNGSGNGSGELDDSSSEESLEEDTLESLDTRLGEETKNKLKRSSELGLPVDSLGGFRSSKRKQRKALGGVLHKK